MPCACFARCTSVFNGMAADIFPTAQWNESNHVAASSGCTAAASRLLRTKSCLLRDLAMQSWPGWAALGVMPRDGYRSYEQSEACPGAFIATCHSGVTLAAAHALLLPPCIDIGNLPNDSLAAFSTRRFDVPTAH